jgi:hypothetical protein
METATNAGSIYSILLFVLGACVVLSVAIAITARSGKNHVTARRAFIAFILFLLAFAAVFYYVIYNVWERVV